MSKCEEPLAGDIVQRTTTLCEENKGQLLTSDKDYRPDDREQRTMTLCKETTAG